MSTNQSFPAVKPGRVFQQLLDQLQEPILLLNPLSGKVLDANVAACIELGYALEELLVLDLFALNPALQKTAFEQCVEQLRSVLILVQEAVFLRKNGADFPVEVKLKYVQLDEHYLVASFHNIENLRLVEKTLREETGRRQLLIEQSRDGIVTLRESGKVYEANQSFATMLGYTLEEVHELYVWDWEKELPKDIVWEMIRALDEKGNHFQTRHTRKDGSVIDVEISSNATPINGEKLIFCVARNITERKQIEAALKLAAMVYQNSLEGMMVLDASGRIISTNPNFTAITGFTAEEVLGKEPPMLQSGQQEPGFYQDIWAELRNLGHWRGEILDRRKNGKVYTAWLSINMVDDGRGQVQSWVAQFADITEKKEAEQLIWFQANFDSLTGLPNRRMFQNKLNEEVKQSVRSGLAMALMFIDLDNFKDINDSLGHDMGDLVLQQVAERLRECVRETDTIARLGGDEFTVILGNLSDVSHLNSIAEKLLGNISRPIMLAASSVNVSASIGITLYPWDANSAEGLLKNADQAMYLSKKQGRNRVNFFSAPLQ